MTAMAADSTRETAEALALALAKAGLPGNRVAVERIALDEIRWQGVQVILDVEQANWLIDRLRLRDDDQEAAPQ